MSTDHFDSVLLQNEILLVDDLNGPLEQPVFDCCTGLRCFTWQQPPCFKFGNMLTIRSACPTVITPFQSARVTECFARMNVQPLVITIDDIAYQVNRKHGATENWSFALVPLPAVPAKLTNVNFSALPASEEAHHHPACAPPSPLAFLMCLSEPANIGHCTHEPTPYVRSCHMVVPQTSHSSGRNSFPLSFQLQAVASIWPAAFVSQRKRIPFPFGPL